MDDIRFADVMQRERERLNHERDAILNQQKELENKLTEINFELAAIDAYEAAKTGKTAMPTRRPNSPTKSEATIRASLALAHSRERGGKPCCKLLGKIRTVLAEAKSLNVWVSRGTNPQRSRCPMPSRRLPRTTWSSGETENT